MQTTSNYSSTLGYILGLYMDIEKNGNYYNRVPVSKRQSAGCCSRCGASDPLGTSRAYSSIWGNIGAL